jgi:hypothetical protein
MSLGSLVTPKGGPNLIFAVAYSLAYQTPRLPATLLDDLAST